MRQVEVADPLAVAVVERLQLARAEHGLDEGAPGSGQAGPHLGVRRRGRVLPARVAERLGQAAPEVVPDLEIAREERRRLRPPPDGDEVDDLDEEARPPLAPLPHGLDEAPEPGDEAVAADAQERAARHVADAGCLHDQHAGLALGEAAVPLEDLGGDVAVLGRPPGHHRRHPRAVGRHAVGAEPDRGEPAGLLGLLARRPARRRERVSDADPGGVTTATWPAYRGAAGAATQTAARLRKPSRKSRGCQVGVTLSRGDSMGRPLVDPETARVLRCDTVRVKSAQARGIRGRARARRWLDAALAGAVVLVTALSGGCGRGAKPEGEAKAPPPDAPASLRQDVDRLRGDLAEMRTRLEVSQRAGTEHADRVAQETRAEFEAIQKAVAASSRHDLQRQVEVLDAQARRIDLLERRAAEMGQALRRLELSLAGIESQLARVLDPVSPAGPEAARPRGHRPRHRHPAPPRSPRRRPPRPTALRREPVSRHRRCSGPRATPGARRRPHRRPLPRARPRSTLRSALSRSTRRRPRRRRRRQPPRRRRREEDRDAKPHAAACEEDGIAERPARGSARPGGRSAGGEGRSASSRSESGGPAASGKRDVPAPGPARHGGDGDPRAGITHRPRPLRSRHGELEQGRAGTGRTGVRGARPDVSGGPARRAGAVPHRRGVLRGARLRARLPRVPEGRRPRPEREGHAPGPASPRPRVSRPEARVRRAAGLEPARPRLSGERRHRGSAPGAARALTGRADPFRRQHQGARRGPWSQRTTSERVLPSPRSRTFALTRAPPRTGSPAWRISSGPRASCRGRSSSMRASGLILDGSHRAVVLARDFGARFAVIQRVDLDSPEVRIGTWCRVLEGVPAAAFDAARRALGLEAGAEGGLRCHYGGHVYGRPGPEASDPHALASEVERLVSRNGHRRPARLVEDEAVAEWLGAADVVVLRPPALDKPTVRRRAEGPLLPPKSTRFLLPYRVLGLAVPLAALGGPRRGARGRGRARAGAAARVSRGRARRRPALPRAALAVRRPPHSRQSLRRRGGTPRVRGRARAGDACRTPARPGQRRQG